MKTVNIVYILLCIASIAFADVTAYNMTHTIKARSIAMGGAFTSVRDGTSSALYNPATMSLNQYRKQSLFSLYVNPVGGYSLIDQYKEIKDQRSMSGLDHLHMIGSFFKAITFASPAFSVQLLLSEPLFDKQTVSAGNDLKMLSSKNMLNSNYDVLLFNMLLDDQIAIGASALIFTTPKEDGKSVDYDKGTVYGVYLRPYDTFSMGICFYDIPNGLSDIFFYNTRILDETINLGVQYQPYRSLSLNLDVRNVSEEDLEVIREIHTGLEWTLGNISALRAGYHYEQETNTNVFSFGFGLLSNNLLHYNDNAFESADFIVNYGMQIKKDKVSQDQYHFLSFLIRI